MPSRFPASPCYRGYPSIRFCPVRRRDGRGPVRDCKGNTNPCWPRSNRFSTRLRRRFSRSEMACAQIRTARFEHTGEKPGLLLIQIDGLSRRQMEVAMEAGRMPFLAKAKGTRALPSSHTFYSGAPSTTPAVQAELYYGVRAGVPAFVSLIASAGRSGTLFNSDWARRLEEKFAAESEGLLAGGSSWSNIYQGGAEESRFCIASLSLSLWRGENGAYRFPLPTHGNPGTAAHRGISCAGTRHRTWRHAGRHRARAKPLVEAACCCPACVPASACARW